ncbi:hypothetical protein EVG20_g9949, partial [Dentipellis fragilis]
MAFYSQMRSYKITGRCWSPAIASLTLRSSNQDISYTSLLTRLFKMRSYTTVAALMLAVPVFASPLPVTRGPKLGLLNRQTGVAAGGAAVPPLNLFPQSHIANDPAVAVSGAKASSTSPAPLDFPDDIPVTVEDASPTSPASLHFPDDLPLTVEPEGAAAAESGDFPVDVTDGTAFLDEFGLPSPTTDVPIAAHGLPADSDATWASPPLQANSPSSPIAPAAVSSPETVAGLPAPAGAVAPLPVPGKASPAAPAISHASPLTGASAPPAIPANTVVNPFPV